MGISMGLGPVLSNYNTDLKRPFRWTLDITGGQASDGLTSVVGNYINMLPPLTASRPTLTFKEIEIEHVSETIYFPSKAQWQPLKVKVYDYALQAKNNLVFDWVKRFYDSKNATYNYAAKTNVGNFKKTATISILNGCGCLIEQWTLEGAWPRNIEWGELDYGNSGILTIDMELKYDRAYVNTF